MDPTLEKRRNPKGVQKRSQVRKPVSAGIEPSFTNRKSGTMFDLQMFWEHLCDRLFCLFVAANSVVCSVCDVLPCLTDSSSSSHSFSCSSCSSSTSSSSADSSYSDSGQLLVPLFFLLTDVVFLPHCNLYLTAHITACCFQALMKCMLYIWLIQYLFTLM